MFKEAEVKDTDKKPDVVSVTTDDLVLWLGEKLVETKYQAKILTLQKNRIVELEGLYLKIQSQEASSTLLVTETKALNEKSLMDLKLQHEQVVNRLKTQHEQTISQLKVDLEVPQVRIKELEEQLSKLQSSRHEYAVSLETKVHEVALERDECKKEISILKAEIDTLKQENETLSTSMSSLQKKKGVKQWLTHSK